MDSSRRVWKWAGAVLAFLCAAMGLCHFLLTQFDENSQALATDPPAIQSSIISGGIAAAHLLPQGAIASAPLRKEMNPNSGFQISDQRHSPEHSPAATGAEEAGGKDAGNPKSFDLRQSEIIHSVRPLGIVQKSDGRVQAVIQDGEWTRLVEEGEVLADHSRVVKVSADRVEILVSNSDSKVELARATSSVQPEAKPEIARADEDAAAPEVEREPAANSERAQLNVQRVISRAGPSEDDLPGMEGGNASFQVTPSKSPLQVLPGDRAEVIDSPRENTPSSVDRGVGLQSRGPEQFGRVEHSDGRVEVVIADGQWVKLAPERAVSEVSPGMDANPVAIPLSLSPSKLGSMGGPSPASEIIQNSESAIPNSGKALGFVEWADGRTLAIVSQESSVEFVDDDARLAEAQRVLPLFPASGESEGDSGGYSADMPGRPREDEAVDLAMVESELVTRGPPEDADTPLAMAEEIARGQPADEGAITHSRAPPATEWEDLPGISEVAEGSIEPLSSIDSVPEAILGALSGAEVRSVPENHPSDAPNTIRHPSNAPRTRQDSAPDSSGAQDRDVNGRLEVLGVVRYQDGRTRTVVSFNDSLLLIEEGDSIPELSAGDSLEANRVIFTSQGSTMTAAGHNPSSHPEVGESHPNLEEPSGSELQTEPRLRDNRKQMRR